jgi:MFS family permease
VVTVRRDTASACRTTGGSDTAWLGLLCSSRMSFALIFTAYSAAIPLLTPAWSLSASQAGLIQSAWHAGYLVSLFVIGFLSDRYGAKRVFLVSSTAASASAVVFAVFADGYLSGALLYGMTGLFSGGSYTPGLTLIAERYAPQRRGRAMGYYLAAASLGYALALLLTGMLTPYIGWRGAFLVNATGPFLGTVLAWFALRRTPNVVHGTAHTRPPLAQVPAVLKNKPVMLAIWAYAFHSWEIMGLKAWLPAFLAAAALAAGHSATEAASLGAVLTAIAYVGSMTGSVAGGALSDRKGRTWAILLMSCASLACSFSLGWMMGLPLWLLVAVAAFYSFAAIGDSSVYSTAVTELVPSHDVGAAYSVRSVLGFGFGALAPWIFGLVLDGTRAEEVSERWSWGLAWTALGAGAVLGPLMTWRLRRLPEAAAMAGGKA